MLAKCPDILTEEFCGTVSSAITRYLHPLESSLYGELRGKNGVRSQICFIVHHHLFTMVFETA
jgi:hypothetical protein